MKERPIIFKPEMVRAILEGRKTQTRRIATKDTSCSKIKWVDGAETFPNGRPYTGWIKECGAVLDIPIKCPYGVPGDRLWVRETWGVGTRPDPSQGWRDGIEYKADEAYIDEIESLPIYEVETPEGVELCDYQKSGKWTPSIHMFRWASRINLEVTNVRVERVQDISDRDCEAEGIHASKPYGGYAGTSYNFPGFNGRLQAAVLYMDIWESINGKKHPWDNNPWVWVVEFKEVE